MPLKHSGGPSSYPTTYLICRTKLHAWDDGDWHEVKDSGKLVGWDEHSKCLRCPAVKVTEYDRGAYQVGPGKIIYPDGYLLAKGEVFSKRQSRLELIGRKTGRARLRSVPRNTA